MLYFLLSVSKWATCINNFPNIVYRNDSYRSAYYSVKGFFNGFIQEKYFSLDLELYFMMS